MAKKNVFKKIAQFLEREKNEGDGTQIIMDEDGVGIYPGENGMIYGYMLRKVYYISEVHHVDYFISSKVEGKTYLRIY